MRQVKINKPSMVEASTKELSNMSIKVKGYRFGLAIGTVDETISLPAEASTLLGMAINTAFNGDFSLNVNNEVVHEKIDSTFAVPMPLGGLGLQPFFPINKKIGGRDNIKLSINSGIPVTVNVIFYYK